MINEVDPVLCNTILLTYGEQRSLELIAEKWFCTKEEALRSIILKGIINELE